MSFFLLLILFTCLNGVCNGCEVGWYGKNCSEVCPYFCRDKECNMSTGKCFFCVKGYYSDNNQHCIRCPDHCTICNSNDFCFACKTGYKGKMCEQICTNCKPDTSCDKNTGYCVQNCTDGLSGELCDVQCDSKCKSCNRYNKHECISCADHENGKVCKEECFNQCLRNTCNESLESCAYECSFGNREVKTCNMTCLSHCKDRVCNITCTETVPPDRPSSPTNNASVGYILLGLIVIIGALIIVYIHVRKGSSERCKGCDKNTRKKEASHVPTGQPSKIKCPQRQPSTAVEVLNETNQENDNSKNTEETEMNPAIQTESGEKHQEHNTRANSSHNNISQREPVGASVSLVHLVLSDQTSDPSKKTNHQTGPSADITKHYETKENGNSKTTEMNPAEQTKSGYTLKQQNKPAYSSHNDTSQSDNVADATSLPRPPEETGNQSQPSIKNPTCGRINNSSDESEFQAQHRSKHDQHKLDYGNTQSDLGNFKFDMLTDDAVEVGKEADNGETKTPNVSESKENLEALSSDKMVSSGAKLQDTNEGVKSKTSVEETKPLLNSDENNDSIPGRSDVCTGQDNKMVAQNKDASSTKSSCRVS